jgi:hypothetical protein
VALCIVTDKLSAGKTQAGIGKRQSQLLMKIRNACYKHAFGNDPQQLAILDVSFVKLNVAPATLALPEMVMVAV